MCVSVYRLDTNLKMELDESNISFFMCTWNVLNLWVMKENPETIKMSVPFELEREKLFRAEFEMSKFNYHQRREWPTDSWYDENQRKEIADLKSKVMIR